MNKNDLRFLLKDKYEINNPSTNIPEKAKNDIKLLKSGYPLAYIIGYVDFLNCKIELKHKVLIPRPETEYWVSTLISDIKLGRVLDIFCGSGCIGISLLKNNPNIHVTFSDIDENAITQTLENLEINHIDKDRYEVIKSDLFENINHKFDYIFANPPYVGISDIVGDEIKHEPQQAIFSGNDGLDIIKNFLYHAPKYLNNGVVIFMEFGSNQKERLAEYLVPRYSAQFFKDQYGKWRFAKLSQKVS